MTNQGTESHLELVAELREIAPHIRDAYDLRKGAMLMMRAADALERLAPLDPEIEVVLGEH